MSDRLNPPTEAARVTLRQYVDLFARTRSCFGGDVYPLGGQLDTLHGPAGLAAVDPATGRRAVVFFGATPQAARSLVPDDFKALVAQNPLTGDEGTDQFTSAYLWHG